MPVSEGMQVMLISNGGTVIRMPVDEIKRLGRSTQGVIVMRLRGDEQVSSIALVAESEEPVEGGETVTEPVPEGVEDSAGENGNLQ
jgi:DNA gyrase subunit A